MDQNEEEYERWRKTEYAQLIHDTEQFTGRRLPTVLVVAIVLAFIAAALGVLMWPLIEGADRWRGDATSCAEPATSGKVAIDADFEDARALTPAQWLAARQSAYVSLNVQTSEGPRSRLGNAFVYDTGIVVTSEHVVRARTPTTEITVTCNEREVPATVTRTNVALDVAILAAPACKGTRLKLATTPIEDGERLIAAGYKFIGPFETDEVPEQVRESLPSTVGFDRIVIVTRYAHVRKADPSAVLVARNVPVDAALDSDTQAENMMIRRNLAEIERRGWPRYLAVRGVAVAGQSGSFLLRPDGSIVGIYSTRFELLNRTFFTPATAILMVLRGTTDDGP